MRRFYAGLRPCLAGFFTAGQARYLAKMLMVSPVTHLGQGWRAQRNWVASIALSSLACSVQTETFEQDANAGSIHAIVRVKRIEMYDQASHGDALAAFVKVPPAADPEQVLILSGLWNEFPAIGECEVESSRAPAANELVAAELVAADGVELLSEAGHHVLAPHAFPSAYNLFRGVVYSSRDQSASDLPASEDYLLSGYGIEANDESSSVELRSRQSSPPFPENVTVMNQPFSGVTAIPNQPVLDFTWERGQSIKDIIVISLITNDISYRCSFEDREGFGTVPLLLASGASVLNLGDDVTVSVHRIRRSHESHPELARVSVGFDYSIEKNWRVADAILEDADALEQEEETREVHSSPFVQAVNSDLVQ